MSTFSHPMVVQSARDKSTLADQGIVLCRQTGTITQNSTTAVDLTFYLPKNSQIVDIIVYNKTAWNSGTSATLSIGTASAGTQYLTSMDVKTPTGLIPLTATHVTTTQGGNWDSIGSNTTVVATVTPSGATSAGVTRVTIIYATPSA